MTETSTYTRIDGRKIANEIIILEHTEIGELYEPFSAGKVGSSTMPHKRNPSTCEAVVGVSERLHCVDGYSQDQCGDSAKAKRQLGFDGHGVE